MVFMQPDVNVSSASRWGAMRCALGRGDLPSEGTNVIVFAAHAADMTINDSSPLLFLIHSCPRLMALSSSGLSGGLLSLQDLEWSLDPK